VAIKNGRAEIEYFTRYKAGYQTKADRKRLHVSATDQILVLARRFLHEAKINADAAARDQHRGEHDVIRRAEILHRFADFLDGGHFCLPVSQTQVI